MLAAFQKHREKYLTQQADREEQQARAALKRKTGQSEAQVELVEDGPGAGEGEGAGQGEEPVGAPVSAPVQPSEVSAPGGLKPVVPHIPEKESSVTTYDDEGKPKKSEGATPVLNGGFTERYSWTQTLSEVTVNVPLQKGVAAKMLRVEIGSTKVVVGLKGAAPIIEGEWPFRVKADETVWTVESGAEGRFLQITVEKMEGMKWWECAVQGDAKIDTSKIEPENSKLSDLDPDTRSTVEKMMLNQQRKAQGLPSLEDEQKNEMLAKFMKAHPEMDFSKAKISG